MENQYPESVGRLQWAIQLAASMHSQGARPSRILVTLADRGVGEIDLIVVGRVAFGVRIPEAKAVCSWWQREKPDFDAIDAYLLPILAEGRNAK